MLLITQHPLHNLPSLFPPILPPPSPLPSPPPHTHTHTPKLLTCVLWPCLCVGCGVIRCLNNALKCSIFYFLHVCSQHVRKPLLLPWLPHLSLLRLCRSSDKSVWRSWEPSKVIGSNWCDSTKPTSSISGIRCPSATTVPRSWSTSLRLYQILWRYEVVTVDVDYKWLWKSLCMDVND